METEKIKVLDGGYIQLIESMGSDESIIASARMSTGKSFLGWGVPCEYCHGKGSISGVLPCGPCGGKGSPSPGDEKLLKFLWDHKHSSPFEMAEMIVEVKAPIMVLREWMRHRTQSYSEMSARYVPLPDDNYVPSVVDVIHRAELAQQSKNRQSQGTGTYVPSFDEVTWWLSEHLIPAYEAAQEAYEAGLEIGIPKELARLPVPVARYSCMRAKANLLNWIKFLALRCDTAAQLEIRAYANQVAGFVKLAFPRTWEIAVKGLVQDGA